MMFQIIITPFRYSIATYSTQSEPSLENVFYSMKIAKEHGFERVTIVSDMAHSFMIKYLAKKFDHEISTDFIPARWRYVILNYWNKFDLKIAEKKACQSGFVHISMRKTDIQLGLSTSGQLWKPSTEVCWTYGSELMN